MLVSHSRAGRCAELASHEVDVHRRPRTAVAPALGRGPTRAAAVCTPPDPIAGGGEALCGQFLGDEAVAELGVIVVDVDRGVDQMRIVVVTLADRFGLTLIEGLLGEAQHPAGHREAPTGSPNREALGWQHGPHRTAR
jgi:hypothetical protein